MKAASSISRLIRAWFCLLISISFTYAAQDSADIALPKPQLDRGRPLMQALKNRKSSREFDSRPLPLQELSNLLWAGFGINRPETGGRTAPSAKNMQEIELYVALPAGLYLYDAKNNLLKKILAEDLREKAGKQPFVKDAPVNIIYVADQSKMKKQNMAGKTIYKGVDAAFISQNIYLYCASEGLATVVRGSVDRPPLAAAMHLRPDQEIIFAQTVGYPKK
jgi:SagB-type dehydrogenase family enzyme